MSYGRTGLRQHVGEPAKAPQQATPSPPGAFQPTRSCKRSLPGFAPGHRVRCSENVNGCRVGGVSSGATASKGREREPSSRIAFFGTPTHGDRGATAAHPLWSSRIDRRIQCPTSYMPAMVLILACVRLCRSPALPLGFGFVSSGQRLTRKSRRDERLRFSLRSLS